MALGRTVVYCCKSHSRGGCQCWMSSGRRTKTKTSESVAVVVAAGLRKREVVVGSRKCEVVAG